MMCEHRPTLKSFVFPENEMMENQKRYYVYKCKYCGEKIYLPLFRGMLYFLCELTVFYWGLMCIKHNWLNLNYTLKIIIPILCICLCLIIIKVLVYFLTKWKTKSTGDSSLSDD